MFGREGKGVLTLYMITMTPKMRTGSADAGWVRLTLESVA
jgi:hypothetical protein